MTLVDDETIVYPAASIGYSSTPASTLSPQDDLMCLDDEQDSQSDTTPAAESRTNMFTNHFKTNGLLLMWQKQTKMQEMQTAVHPQTL